MKKDVGSKAAELSERLLEWAAGIIKATGGKNSGVAGAHVFKQMVRSAPSAGANYEEARGAESRADFVHKLQISLKELRESIFWLRLSQKSELAPLSLIDPLLQEARELAQIIGKSIVTAKRNGAR